MALFENKKQLMMIVVAVGVGVAASIMVAGYVTGRINDETQRLALQYEKIQKQKEQQFNEQMAALNQRIMQVQESSRRAAEDAARAAATAVQQQQASGQKPGQAAPVPEGPKVVSLAVKTPPGKRAITVNIDSLGAVGGLINPGDFVDVIAQMNVPKGKSGEKKESVTAMIFQKLQILAINTNMDKPGDYPGQQGSPSLKITFAVNPQEAGLLAFAEKNGRLQLTLRAPTETKNVMLSTATWSTLAEYVLENNGADLKVSAPDLEAQIEVESEDVDEVRPYIQIFKGGREL